MASIAAAAEWRFSRPTGCGTPSSTNKRRDPLFVNELHVGLKGTMNALFLKDLAQKTRRGLQGRVLQGLSGGGVCYGYDLVAGETGSRRVNANQAKGVQAIFREFAAGLSPRAIAKKLNQKGIAGPSGRPWRDTTIRGHFGRGTGILNNELYIGRLIWNRLTYLKDPKTGRRRSRHNPPEKWIVQDVPDLRVVDDDLWQAVKARQGSIRASDGIAKLGLPGFGSAGVLATC